MWKAAVITHCLPRFHSTPCRSSSSSQHSDQLEPWSCCWGALWRPSNFTPTHSLTGPLGQPFASCLGGQWFASWGCTTSQWNWVSPVSVVSLQGGLNVRASCSVYCSVWSLSYFRTVGQKNEDMFVHILHIQMILLGHVQTVYSSYRDQWNRFWPQCTKVITLESLLRLLNVQVCYFGFATMFGTIICVFCRVCPTWRRPSWKHCEFRRQLPSCSVVVLRDQLFNMHGIWQMTPN